MLCARKHAAVKTGLKWLVQWASALNQDTEAAAHCRTV